MNLLLFRIGFSVLMALAVSSSEMVYAGGYGAAGCGLGSVIFGSERGTVQVFAATTNNIFFGSQTLGITFGTSNCGGGGAAPTVKAFIEANREALANDIARGNGETLNGLTQLMGCTKPAQVGPVLQKSYKTIFPNTKVSASDIETSVTPIVKANCS